MAKKLVMFDMDGVLFDSMPGHAKAWAEMMKSENIDISEMIVFEKEGMTGPAFIKEVLGEAGEERYPELYKKKAAIFESYPPAPPMPGALEAVRTVNECGASAIVVTGSGQKHLMARIDEFYPDLFKTEWMVSALDVKNGKPAPDPYLAGLRKAGVEAGDAIVIENAPLGVRSGKAAGCYTVAVNTGPLPDSVLLAEGADMLFHSMKELADNLKLILK